MVKVQLSLERNKIMEPLHFLKRDLKRGIKGVKKKFMLGFVFLCLLLGVCEKLCERF